MYSLRLALQCLVLASSVGTVAFTGDNTTCTDIKVNKEELPLQLQIGDEGLSTTTVVGMYGSNAGLRLRFILEVYMYLGVS